MNPAYVNQPVTFSVVVSGIGPTPTGSVTFEAGTTNLGTVSLANGQASLTTTFTTTGSFSIVASYSGDQNYEAASSSPLTQVVSQQTPAIALTSNINPSYVDQSVTFSVVVSGSGPTPTGTVTLEEGNTALGTAMLVNGQASLTTAFKKSGSFSIVASYSGDQNYKAANSAPLKQVVQKQYPTTTTLTSSSNPSTYGEAVTFTAIVKSSGPTPTGTVTFKNGSKMIGSATLSDGAAQIATSTLPVGNLAITATYSGDVANKKSMSSPLEQVVNQATSTTAVASSLNPSQVGQKVKFTATVTSPTTTPTGTVEFLDGTTELGTGTLKKGKATYSTSSLSQGSHNITAVYEGTADVSGSTSPVLVQNVN